MGQHIITSKLCGKKLSATEIGKSGESSEGSNSWGVVTEAQDVAEP